jgi:hypothetical protein
MLILLPPPFASPNHHKSVVYIIKITVVVAFGDISPRAIVLLLECENEMSHKKQIILKRIVMKNLCLFFDVPSHHWSVPSYDFIINFVVSIPKKLSFDCLHFRLERFLVFTFRTHTALNVTQFSRHMLNISVAYRSIVEL